MSKRKNASLVDSLFAVARQEALRARKNDSVSQKAAFLRTLLMAIQRDLEADKHPRVAVGSPRQTGKSTGVMLIVLIRCLELGNAEWVVVGLTRPSIKSIYWGPLKQLNQQFELGISFHNQELTATLPNGSRIRFVGADNIGEIEKLRGGRYNGVIIDECKSFPAFLFRELVHDIIEPALMAKNGQLYVIGTPGEDLAGPFFEATADEPIVYCDETGKPIRQSYRRYGTTCELPFVWSTHKWTMEDNTTVFTRGDGSTYTMWDQALDIKARNQWPDNHPTWLREFKGRWVAADTKKVFRYVPHRHDYRPMSDTKWGIPEAKGGYKTVIGVDFGTRDGTAMVVWAWSPYAKDLWELHSEVRTRAVGERMTVSEIAEWYRDLERDFGPFEGWPADPAGLATMVMDTLADEHGVFLEPAEKKEKLDHIELFNNDLEAGHIRIREGSVLSQQLMTGRWDLGKLDKGKREEDPKIPNDVADAAIYSFRWCNHRRSQAAPHVHTMFSPQWWSQQAARELSDAEKRARDRAAPQKLDDEWWNDPS